MSRRRLKLLVTFFGSSFLMHLVWENAQMPLYKADDVSVWESFEMCLFATARHQPPIKLSQGVPRVV